MWSAEITNDPSREYQLYIELLENDVYRGRLEPDEQGGLELKIYSSETPVNIPVGWLIEVIKSAQNDFARG